MTNWGYSRGVVLNNMKRLFFILSISIILTSCRLDNQSSLQVDNGEIMSALQLQLENENIEYRLTSDNVIEVKKDHYDALVKHHRIAFERVLPPGRHSSFPSKIHSAIKTKFDEDGYKYKTVCHDKVEWIVWGKEDSEEIEALTNQVIMSTIEILNSRAVLENEELDMGDDITPCEQE